MAASGEHGATPLRSVDPIVEQDNAFFWEAGKRGELVARACAHCGDMTHPPVPMCPQCHGVVWRERVLSGRGTVTGWLKVHHPATPLFDYPLRIVTVKLEEGPELVSNLVDADVFDDPNDLPVEVTFAPTKGGWAVPLFRPRSSSSVDGDRARPS